LKKGAIQALKFTGFLAAGLLLLWLAFRKTDFSKLGEDLRKADYSWLLLSIIFGSFAFISRARRWILLIAPLGYHPRLRHSFYALMTGYLANLALPRVGEITRCVALGRKENIPVDQLVGTVVVERTVDFLSLMSILVILLFTKGNETGLFIKEFIFAPLQDKLLNVFGVTWVFWGLLLLAGLFTLYLIYRNRHNLRKIRLFAKFFDLSKGVINGLKTITTLKKKKEFIFHTVFIWINYLLMTWVVVFALESTSHLTIGDSVFLLVIGGLAMSAPVQSGLGVFHYTISQGLLIVKGLPLEDGLAYALLTHESQLIFVAIIGTISFFMIFKKHPKENKT
jgi:uncharacterized protein (TIRG00374 family)